MKKVLISPGYGSGFASWNEHGRRLAEDPELIALVEAGKHKGTCTLTQLANAGVSGAHPVPSSSLDQVSASFEFAKRAYEIANGYVCLGGVPTLEIREVTGAYRIKDHDGNETLEHAPEGWW